MISYLITCIALATTPSLDVRIEGEGFFRFAREGEEVFAKQTTLTVKSGKLCSIDGPWLLPVILVEGEPKSLAVDASGRVKVDYGQGERYLGRIILATFADDIRPVESRGFLVAYDKPKLGEANDGPFGKILSGSDAMNSVAVNIREHVKSEPTPKTDENRVKIYLPDEKEVTTPTFKPDVQFLKSGGVQIVLPESSTVSSDRIRLGEVATVFANADISPIVSALDLGASPVFGVPRQVTADRIIQVLRISGVSADKIRIVGSRLTVKLESQTITQADFDRVAIAAAQERFGDIEVESDRPVPDLEVPKGQLELVAENIVKSGNSVAISVTAYVDGKRINSRNIKLYNTTVPITLKTGDKVTVAIIANDISVEVSGKVRKIDGVTGEITVLLETGSEVVGRVNKKGFVEVRA